MSLATGVGGYGGCVSKGGRVIDGAFDADSNACEDCILGSLDALERGGEEPRFGFIVLP